MRIIKPLSALSFLSLMAAPAFGQEYQARPVIQAEGEYQSPRFEGADIYGNNIKIELVLDSAGMMDKDAVGSVMSNIVKRLNIQASAIFGTDEDHFELLAPLHGLSHDRFGRGENRVNVWGVALAGAGGRKTFYLKKSENGDLKLSINANVVAQYITTTDNKEITCDDCITDLNNAGNYSDPRSMDFAVQANLDLQVEYNRFKMTAYYQRFTGGGGGTMDFTNSKKYGSKVDKVPVDFNTTLKSSRGGLRLDYALSKRTSIFAKAELNGSYFTERLDEGDINQTYYTTETEEVQLSNGTYTNASYQVEHQAYQEGHHQKIKLDSENFEFGVGVRFSLD